jgi:YbbR domain-containing protein
MFARSYSDNRGLKLLAIGLSILLFSVVHSDTDAQRAIFLDVVVLLPPPSSGKMLVSEVPAQVKVTLTGSRSKLSSLSRDDFSPVQMDLRDAKDDDYAMDLGAITVGSGVHVSAISPAVVPLAWAVAAETRVRVDLQIGTALDKDVSLQGEIELTPAFVSIRGPQDRLERFNTVSTDPISLAGLRVGSHTRRVALEPLPERVSYVDDQMVEIRLQVVPLVVERTYARLEVSAIGEGRASIRPNRVSVVLRGPEGLMTEIAAEHIVPIVEMAQGGGSETTSAEVRLRGVPEGVEVVRIMPSSVIVRVEGKR